MIRETPLHARPSTRGPKRRPDRAAAIAFWPTLVLAPAALALAAHRAADRPRRRRARRAALLAAGGAFLGLGAVRWQLARLFLDEPAHEVERRDGAFEVRRYAPFVRAETDVSAVRWDDALREGFRRLAGYIFGRNLARERIGMTAPVTSSSRREKLAMTTPVMMQARAGGHVIAFVMPPGRSVDDLPMPADERVHLEEIPARRVAVLRFRGGYDGTRTLEKQTELLALVRREGLRARGAPSFAGYDPPWTLPWLRRQEVWVEVE